MKRNTYTIIQRLLQSMNTSFSYRLTMAMAMAIVVALEAFASACEDNPDSFLFKKKQRTCNWVANRKPAKKDKFCETKKKIYENCPVTCGICEPPSEPPFVPPGPCNVEPEEGSPCELGTDERCYADYTNRSCSSNVYSCTPGVSYECTDDDEDGSAT